MRLTCLEAPSCQVGVWDFDDKYCVIEQGDPPTGGCIGGKESTASDVVDKCCGRGPGDGKCERACGADAACDEKNPNEECGTNARCTSYCSCCVASDSDNGKDYLKKGTATGLMFEGGYLNCSTKTDYCNSSTTVTEYYINSSGHLNYEYHYCGNEENKKCVDGHCGCEDDSDCPASPVNNTKGKCDITGSVTGKPKTCYWNPCKYNSDCVDGTCCTADPNGPNPGGTGSCVGKGIYSDNQKYLCDPPEWHAETQTKTQNIFELALNFLSHFFQR